MLRRFLEKPDADVAHLPAADATDHSAGGGTATTRQIAAAFLAEDESQLEYYEAITNGMPGKVLRRHGVVERNGDRYRLAPRMVGLKRPKIDALIAPCDAAIRTSRRLEGLRSGSIGQSASVRSQAAVRRERNSATGHNRLGVQHRGRRGTDHPPLPRSLDSETGRRHAESAWRRASCDTW